MYFSDSQEVYDTIGELVRQIAGSHGLGNRLRETNVCIQLRLTDPAAIITVPSFVGESATVEFETSRIAPTVTLETSSDLAHELFSGQVTLMYLVNESKLKLGGLSQRLAGLWPAIEFAAPAQYERHLTSIDRQDLVLS